MMEDPALGTAIVLFIWLICAAFLGKREEWNGRR